MREKTSLGWDSRPEIVTGPKEPKTGQGLTTTAIKTLRNSTVRVRRICEKRQVDWEWRHWAGCHCTL